MDSEEHRVSVEGHESTALERLAVSCLEVGEERIYAVASGDAGVRSVEDAFVVCLNLDAGGVQCVGAAIKQAIKALAFELTAKGGELETEHR